jgi:hypothetical protein
LCEEFAQITRNFWWGDELDRRKTHWKSWEKIIAPKYFGGLGFRDYRFFNQALLARQAWRLLVFPHSLCARLFKAKYFPNAELTDTAFIQNSSPGWQGICHGLELLKKGVIWRVQSGSKIRIWRDNWVPRGNLKASTKIGGGRYRWVSDLIDNSSMTWKEDLVRSMFPNYDAEEILRICLPHSAEEDYIALHFEKSGNFSVRSAYRLALLQNSENFCSGQQSDNPNGDRPIWDVIWKTKVPQKVKIFSWRLATDALAVQKNRCSRNMTTDPTCTICGREEEDGYHATMTCTKAAALRESMRKIWKLPPEEKLRNSGKEWTLNILNASSPDMRGKLMLVWWRAWHLRNNCSFGDGKVGINQSTDFLSNYWQVLSNIREEKQPEDRKGKSPMLEMKEIHEKPKKNKRKSSWKPPDTGWQCLSVDASFIKESNFASWGALARNHLGQIKWSAWGILSDCDNAETAEALACLEGIKQAVKLVDSSLIIESDCDALIKKANSAGRDRSHTSSVLADIHRLVTLLPNFIFRKVAREDNRPAHELARFSRVSCTGGVLQGSAPPCVLELTLVECNQNSTTD